MPQTLDWRQNAQNGVGDLTWTATRRRKFKAQQSRSKKLQLRDGKGCYYCTASGKPYITRTAYQPWRIAKEGGDGWVKIVEVQFNVDHVIPRAEGGCNHLANLVWSCVKCNTDKAHTLPTLELWRPSPLARIHANWCIEIAANRWELGLPVLTYPIL